MTHAQLESMAAPGALKAGGNDDPAVCEVYQFGSGGAVILEERGRVGRISLYEPGLTTVEGITVGDQAATVLEVYGDAAQRESAAYADPPAHDLYVWRSSEAGLRFEIDQAGIVSAIHGGNQTIRYIEGCQ
ncbi:hypothetical protein [Caulobacter sp. NIBR1757]|uniref:hypothetical protein n=1 Tax=Caulobacter sp. NIBR1757 TaxID=3016000 RepID=UPI0022F006E2|nr:hypothetical protein [Caulobacter sp. NIBR1757]WGM39394.1 hypothetical protein AMEJIAPC_02313 [Caulobacter sp. NIBR1757]